MTDAYASVIFLFFDSMYMLSLVCGNAFLQITQCILYAYKKQYITFTNVKVSNEL